MYFTLGAQPEPHKTLDGVPINQSSIKILRRINKCFRSAFKRCRSGSPADLNPDSCTIIVNFNIFIPSSCEVLNKFTLFFIIIDIIEFVRYRHLFNYSERKFVIRYTISIPSNRVISSGFSPFTNFFSKKHLGDTIFLIFFYICLNSGPRRWQSQK
jgi:hypothetical protein